MRQDIFNYALKFPGASSSSVFKFGSAGIDLESGRPGDAVEFRFKLVDADTYPTLPTELTNQVIYSSEGENGGIRVRWSGSGNDTDREGYVDVFYVSGSSYATHSVGPAPIYNGDWWTFIYQRTSGSNSDNITQTYNSFLKQKDFNGIDRHFSSSYTSTNDADNTKNILRGTDLPMTIGGITSSNSHGYMYAGELQEFRIYTKALKESVFNGHVLSPESYASNNPTGSFYDLGFRLKFGTEPLEWNHSVYTIVSSSHPNQDITTWNGVSSLLVATGSGWANKSSYNYNEEEVVPKMPKVLGLQPVEDEIIIADENPTITNSNGEVVLSRDASVLKKSTELSSPAASKIGIYFSPTNEINKDIMNHMGDFKLDDILGDPEEEYDNEYSTLREFRNEYFKKNKEKYNYVDYFNIIKYYDTSIFRAIQSQFDAKTKALTGVVIEPHILERNKVKTLNQQPSYESLNYDTELSCSKTIEGQYSNMNIATEMSQSPDLAFDYVQMYTGSVENVTEIESEYLKQYTSSIDFRGAIITSTVPYTTTDGSETVGELGKEIELAQDLPIFEQGTSKFYDELNFTNSDVNKPGFSLATPTRSFGAQYYIGYNYIRDILETVTGSRTTSQYQVLKGFFTSSNYNPTEMNISASMGIYESSSFAPAEYIPPFETARIRSKWEGSKITSPDWNRAATNSTEGTVNKNGKQNTPDGGPVVEIFKADPNKLIYKPTAENGNFSIESEFKRKRLMEEKNPINPFSYPIDLFRKLLDNRRRNL